MGMKRIGGLFEECVALLGIDAQKVKNWLSNHRRKSGQNEAIPGPSTLPPAAMPPVPPTSLPKTVLYKPAKNRRPSVSDAFQRLAGDQLRAEGILKGVKGGAAQINARAAEIAATMDGDERRLLEDSVIQAKAVFAAGERQMTKKEHEEHMRYHSRGMSNHAAALDQLGSSTLMVQYFPDTEQGKGIETGQYGKMASTVQTCIEDAAGVPLDVILGGSLLNARKRNQTSDASARDGNLKMLRKEVRDKMLESINGFLSTAGKPLRVELPSAELERRCPFVLADKSIWNQYFS